MNGDHLIRHKNIPSLNWDVLIAPQHTHGHDCLPSGHQTDDDSSNSINPYLWQANAVVLDVFITIKQDDDLVNWVLASGKNLSIIYGVSNNYVSNKLYISF